MPLIDQILRWIWSTPVVRNVLIRSVATEVGEVVHSLVAEYRAAARIKEAAARQAKLDELLGQTMKMQAPELEALLDALLKEPSAKGREDLIAAIRVRLDVFKKGT